MTVPPPVTSTDCRRSLASAAKSASPLRDAVDSPRGTDSTPGEAEGEPDPEADGDVDGDFARYAKPAAMITNSAHPSNEGGGRRF